MKEQNLATRSLNIGDGQATMSLNSKGLRQRKGGEGTGAASTPAEELAEFFIEKGQKGKAEGAAALLAQHGQPSVAYSLQKKYGAVPTGWAVPVATGGGGFSFVRALAILALTIGAVGAVFGCFHAVHIPLPRGMRKMEQLVTNTIADALKGAQPETPAAPAEAPEEDAGPKPTAEQMTKRSVTLAKHNYAINTGVQIINMAAALSDEGEMRTTFGQAEKELLVPIEGAMEGNERQQFFAHSALATMLHSYFFDGNAHFESRANDAREHYAAAAALDDSDANMLFHYGSLLYKMGKPTEAVTQLLRSVEKEGSGAASAATRHNLALAYAMLDKDKESDAMFAMARDIDPKLAASFAITKLADDLTVDSEEPVHAQDKLSVQ